MPSRVSKAVAVCRPLHRVAAWLADMGLAISPGTLADSTKRFVPLFEPLAEEILAHQNEAAVMGGESLPMVGRILGHTQTQTTARYAHLADDPLQKASERIASSLKQAMDG